jgi:hypothetical protein
MLPKTQLSELEKEKFDEKYSITTKNWKKSGDFQFQIYQKEEIADIISRIQTTCAKAITYLDVMQGIVPYSIENHTKEIIEKRAFHSPRKISNEYGMWIQGRAISRFCLTTSEAEYLHYGPWLHRPRQSRYFEGPRILVQEITGGHPSRIAACYCDFVLYHDPGIISCLNKSNFNIYFLLGIINSKFISWYHRNSSPKGTRHAFPKVLIGDIRNFPLPNMQSARPENQDRQGRMTKLVEQMLELHKRLQQTRTPHEKESLKRQIEATDNQIDQLVYQLYGLTDDEISIIEEAQIGHSSKRN